MASRPSACRASQSRTCPRNQDWPAEVLGQDRVGLERHDEALNVIGHLGRLALLDRLPVGPLERPDPAVKTVLVAVDLGLGVDAEALSPAVRATADQAPLPV